MTFASWLPSCWGADRQSVWRTLVNGGRVGFVARSRAILPSLRLIRPSMFFAPPSFWKTLHSEYLRKTAGREGEDYFIDGGEVISRYANFVLFFFSCGGGGVVYRTEVVGYNWDIPLPLSPLSFSYTPKFNLFCFH